MGYAVGSQCWSTAGEAADALYSAVPPRLTDTGYQAFEKSGDVWHLNVYQTGGAASQLVAQTVVAPVLPECSLEQRTADGIQLGMLTLTPAIMAWCVLALKKAL